MHHHEELAPEHLALVTDLQRSLARVTYLHGETDGAFDELGTMRTELSSMVEGAQQAWHEALRAPSRLQLVADSMAQRLADGGAL